MSSLSRDDVKFLFAGVLGALLIVVVIFAAYQGWQRAHKQAVPDELKPSPEKLTPEQRDEALEHLAPPPGAPVVSEEEKANTLQNLAPTQAQTQAGAQTQTQAGGQTQSDAEKQNTLEALGGN